MRTCRKCDRETVTSRCGPATCDACQPRKNTTRKLPMRTRQGTVRGERHGRALLTETDVRTIRARLEAGERCVTLATDFGVTHSTVSLIKRGLRWQPVG